METCKSPRKVLVTAYGLAKQFLPDHNSKFSRRDFTLPQLFACLVLREHQKKSYRGVDALLEDCPNWRADTGSGGDQPFFRPLLLDAWRWAHIRIAVADAGFDSEANHRLARLDLGVRSIIPPNAGRPTDQPAPTRFRRLMQRRFQRKADQKYYGQRWQVETVNSMIKRNLGSALRARTARRRSRELFLRVITHNLMILTNARG